MLESSLKRRSLKDPAISKLVGDLETSLATSIGELFQVDGYAELINTSFITNSGRNIFNADAEKVSVTVSYHDQRFGPFDSYADFFEGMKPLIGKSPFGLCIDLYVQPRPTEQFIRFNTTITDTD